MPISRNAQLRLRILNSLFRRRGEGYTMRQLIEEVSLQMDEFGARRTTDPISERQIREDIRILRADPPNGYGAPITNTKKRYKYSDPHFSITESELTQTDKRAIAEAIMILRQFEGLPLFLPLENYLARIEGAYLAAKPTENIIMLETNPLTAGTQWLKPTIEAIRHQLVLDIVYRPFNADEICHTLHPYLIKEFRNRWFLFGRDNQQNKLIWLTFDRIYSLQTNPHTIPFVENNLFDPHTYFNDFIGVTLSDNATLTNIVLQTTLERAKYMRTKPLHQSQREIGIAADGSIQFSLALIPNFEFYADIAAMSHDLRVVSPDHVRLHFIERLRAGLDFQER